MKSTSSNTHRTALAPLDINSKLNINNDNYITNDEYNDRK
jgi:hypothetical protein